MIFVAESRIFVPFGLILLLYLHVSYCSPHKNLGDSNVVAINHENLSPAISPSVYPQPLLPGLAPSQLFPFTNNTAPKLSGLCGLNLSGADYLLTKTATNCWSSLAPYLANVVCCPQLLAASAILLGQYGKNSKNLALNATHAELCSSDINHLLESKGANMDLYKICQIYPSNLTGAACPITDIDTVESIIDGSRILSVCEKIDLVAECCEQKCQDVIEIAAEKLTLKNSSKKFEMVNDCRSIVIRWLASKFDIASANRVLRGISSCKVNKVCPLVLPNAKNISSNCGEKSDKTICCEAMVNYMSNLQNQSFVTNVQALHCASLLSKKLERANVTSDVYDSCGIYLKDFSLQVESQETGCLLPSLPSDVTYDISSGISFVCDLNDNVVAPWYSNSSQHASSCTKTAAGVLPALLKADSARADFLEVQQYRNCSLLLFCFFILNFLAI